MNHILYISYTYKFPTSGVNIYNYLRQLTEYYISINSNDKLYFKFLNNTDIQLEYYYIKYLFLKI